MVLVERDIIGFFGKMNAGKSTLMNMLTQQRTSIVDETPGTTADVKVNLQEIHGMGPVKLYDTPGADEQGELGKKKKEKVFEAIKECDLLLIVIDIRNKNLSSEKEIISFARENDKQIIIIYNLFESGLDIHQFKKYMHKKIPDSKFYPYIAIAANDENYRQELLDFILKNFTSKNEKRELLPFIERDEFYILIIPMDEETPPGRYLRPQAMCEEYITRHWAYPISFRIDLGKARSGDESERKRFNNFLNSFSKRPKAMITDSQAMDIMHKWTPDDIMLTTFSITMVNYFSRGRLKNFAEGLKYLEGLKEGDKILITEACNHSRICNDIGTVQIPNLLKKIGDFNLEFNFGKIFETAKLEESKLVIHCGGCMMAYQKFLARIRDMDNLNVPYTNYGLFFSYMQGKDALRKVLEPWGLQP